MERRAHPNGSKGCSSQGLATRRESPPAWSVGNPWAACWERGGREHRGCHDILGAHGKKLPAYHGISWHIWECIKIRYFSFLCTFLNQGRNCKISRQDKHAWPATTRTGVTLARCLQSQQGWGALSQPELDILQLALWRKGDANRQAVRYDQPSFWMFHHLFHWESNVAMDKSGVSSHFMVYRCR